MTKKKEPSIPQFKYKVTPEKLERAVNFLADGILRMSIDINNSKGLLILRRTELKLPQNPAREVEDLSVNLGVWLAKELINNQDLRLKFANKTLIKEIPSE